MKYLFQIVALLCMMLPSRAQDLTALYESVSPAVVVLLTKEKEVVHSASQDRQLTSSGLGSGFMISDSQVVTAAHVVQVAESLQVLFPDGEVIPGDVVSTHKGADVALVKLVWPKRDAVTVPLGDSDHLKVGQQVFIVGAPFGLAQSLSSGYVSGIVRDQKGRNPFSVTEFVQTDAAINQGNSGGPMFNMDGEVIGVVSNILTKSGGFDGIGFAATSNLARKLLLEKKFMWLGMDSQPLTGNLARLFNIPQSSGLLVERVAALSVLDIMGVEGGDTEVIINGNRLIMGGDIILAFNGIEFDLTDQSMLKIWEFAEGFQETDTLELTVLRGGETMTLKKQY